MKKIGFEKTKITDGFWKERQNTVKNTNVYAVYDRFVQTHRFDALECKACEPQNAPHVFWDSDVAKWIEGAAYIISETPNEKLENIIDDAVEKIAENADENGYFNSHYLVAEQDKRFTERSQHELYCAGHLIEAAVAYYETTGKDKFLKLMCRYADYIEKVFKTEKSALFATPGHPELELALVKLYGATGEKRYLELSKFFIDEHGCNDRDGETLYRGVNNLYNQDEMPLRERTSAEGHAVRALYLFCAAADIAVHCDDGELLNMCKRVFDDMTEKKMYITGGLGSTHIGESFSVQYYLPNRTAYAETCAAIAMALFCERMQQAEVNSKYADIAEKVIYNGVLSGMSLDGKSFFYENPLEIAPRFNNVNPSTHDKERFPITERVEVFDCSCCPPNIVRFIPSIADLMYTYDSETLFVHQYINSKTVDGEIEIEQYTDYPSDGKIVVKCSAPQKYIALRIPSWCKSFKLNKAYELKNGYAYVTVEGSAEIKLNLDMPAVFVKSNRNVSENAGRVAVMRGPVVYCAESVDNGSNLKCVCVDTSKNITLCEKEFLVPSLEAEAYREKESDKLYTEIGDDYEKISLKMIPYFTFANRGECEMLVWFLRK